MTQQQQPPSIAEMFERPDFKRMFNIVLGATWTVAACGMLAWTGDYLPIPVAPLIAFGGVKWANKPLLRLDRD